MIKADYVDHMGSDVTVCNAARVSFAKESHLTEEGDLAPGDLRLLTYLAKHGHFTPSTHPQITLRETVPIFVARQRFKHVVGFTYNEVSRRYVDDAPEFYVPEEWRNRPEGSLKQGSSGVSRDNEEAKAAYTRLIADCKETYCALVATGIAPEQARMVLPQSMLTSYYVTGSLAAFARAYKLRIDTHAQQEIQELAKQWDAVIQPLFPNAWNALTT